MIHERRPIADRPVAKVTDSIESALRDFKKRVASAGVITELAKREHALTKAQKRRRKSRAARARVRKDG